MKQYRWSQRSIDLRISTTPHLAGPGDASSESGPTGLAFGLVGQLEKKMGEPWKEVEKKDVCVFFVAFFFVLNWW